MFRSHADLILLSETAFFIALTALANPTVQLKLAEWIASWWAGNFFAFIGNVTDVTMKTLDSLTDGAIGGDTLRDAIGFKKGVAKMPAGTAWASSEWAKLAFQDLIFVRYELFHLCLLDIKISFICAS